MCGMQVGWEILGLDPTGEAIVRVGVRSDVVKKVLGIGPTAGTATRSERQVGEKGAFGACPDRIGGLSIASA